MNALRVLASPRIWLTVVVVAVVLALIYVAYLAPVVSPEENLEDLPIALVNEDEGAELAGERVDFGDRVVENVTAPDSPAADTVGWARPDSRQEALGGLGRKEFYGAIVIPADYSEKLASIASPPEITIAVVNEDAGAEMNGRPVNLGEEVADRITSPDSPAPPFVEWAMSAGREEALKDLEAGEVYAAIIVPKDYSQRLASISGPPPGTPAEMPAGASAPPAAGQPPAPEPAEIELLTSPAVRPSTAGLIENAFTGIVGGISGATSERILGGLSEAGMPVPPGVGAVISDPVRGDVSEADVSGEAGPLPKAPEPAEIEVLTNQAAGQAPSSAAQNISTAIVEAVSRATSERLSSAAGERGAQLTPEVAAAVGDPVRAELTEAYPVGPDSGNGQSPVFLAFLANLSGLMGAAVVFFVVRSAAETLAARDGRMASNTGLWTVRLLAGLVYAAIVAAIELWVAFGLMSVEHDASTAQVYAFLALAIAAAVSVAMFLVAALGPAGIGIAAILTVILGLVSSGGTTPLEALPGFYQAYADWLPLRYVTDGLRSLLFYDGALEAARLEGGWRDSLPLFGGDRYEAAGLEDAIWVLAAYLAGSAVLGYTVSILRDLLGSRRAKSKPDRETGEPAAEAIR